MKSIRPPFFIVGAPKAGTTALHLFLDKHPEVCMSTDKEPNYFSHKEIKEQLLYYKKTNSTTESEYLSLFHPTPKTKIAGEGSVSYLFYPMVPERIKNFSPDAKIIISLRNPVQRAFSHYQMDYSLGYVNETFEQIFRNGQSHPKTGNHFQQYFLLGNYGTQVERYLKTFGDTNVLIILHQDIIQSPKQVIQKLCHFLGIDDSLLPAEIEQHNVTMAGKNKIIQWLYKQKLFRKTIGVLVSEQSKAKVKSLLFSKQDLPQLDQKLAVELQQYYRDEMLLLQRISTLDIKNWIHD
ncbi:MAG: sulfotransferase domain-containing protein [Bacteroidetes bacterium]|nr:sulfotransferase domain-containing protein [Bacteroidota bacterium]